MSCHSYLSSHMVKTGFLKMVDLQVTMAFNVTMIIHDLDDLGYPYLGNVRKPHVNAVKGLT